MRTRRFWFPLAAVPLLALPFALLALGCSSETPAPNADAGGSDAGAEAAALAKPCPSGKGPTMVRVPARGTSQCIDSTEVTRVQYAAFLADVKAGVTLTRDALCTSNASVDIDSDCMNERLYCKSNCDQHPQVCVSWCAAHAYCAWAGKKLCGSLDGSVLFGPTPDLKKSAWMNICGSGTRDDGEPELKYSYGEDYQADACNTGSCDTKGDCGTAPVGSFPKCQGQGPFAGVFDMVGNVSEWVDERGNGSATSVGYRGSDFDRDAVISGCNGVTSTADLPTLASPYTGIRCCAD
jgi:formylglycine-generating enzyme